MYILLDGELKLISSIVHKVAPAAEACVSRRISREKQRRRSSSSSDDTGAAPAAAAGEQQSTAGATKKQAIHGVKVSHATQSMMSKKKVILRVHSLFDLNQHLFNEWYDAMIRFLDIGLK